MYAALKTNSNTFLYLISLISQTDYFCTRLNWFLGVYNFEPIDIDSAWYKTMYV